MNRLMKMTAFALIPIMLSGCAPGASPSAVLPAESETAPVTDSRPNVNGGTDTFTQRAYEYDYSNIWWPDGYSSHGENGQPGAAGRKELYASTGRYGLSISAVTGGLARFGAYGTPLAQKDSAAAEALIASMPRTVTKYSVKLDGKDYALNQVVPSEGGTNSTRILESGRFIQRADVMYLQNKERGDITGRFEVMLTPEFFSMNIEVSPAERRLENIELTMQLYLQEGDECTVSQDGASAFVCGKYGSYTVIVPSGSGARLFWENGYITAKSTVKRIAKHKFGGFGVIVVPKTSEPDPVPLYRAMEAVTAEAEQLSPRSKKQKTAFDARHGFISVDINNAFSPVEGELTEKDLDTYEKVRFTLKNDSDRAVRIPVQFIKEQPLSVTGPTPMLLDPLTGEPTGHAVQITRNWHYYDAQVASDSPRRYWEGRWYHCYTVIEIPAHSGVSYDFCVSYARWGGIESVTHSQLCLAGWGGQQQWESCSLGAYGESFCYDTARSYTHCSMGDICAFGLYSRVDGKKYNWTTNIGGADFLGYTFAGGTGRVKGMKTFFKNHGPCLSEVFYSGSVGDKITFDISARTPRTDDISMAYQSFSYTFSGDVSYDRMWFYQFGADTYNYDYWDTMAVGNSEGPVSFNAGGTKTAGVFALPAVDGIPGYMNSMLSVQMPGEGAWFAFLGAERGQSKGNKAIGIKEYRAVINGKEYTSPSFSVRTTGVYVSPSLSWEGAGFELNPPTEAGGIIKAGSTVSFTLIYFNLPAHREDCWSQSEYLASIDPEKWNTWHMPYTYATQSSLSVSASAGTVKRLYTPLIRAENRQSGTAAEFTLAGGTGYVPVTISGVSGYSGWRLEFERNGDWYELEQGVHGNDYWQTWYDASDGTFELTFNVPSSKAPQKYRLIKKQ